MRKSKIVQSIGLVMVVLSLLGIMLSISVSATSQGSITFSCTEFDSVRGETFTTTVYAEEGSNVTGLDLTLTYNSEYVTLESYDVVRASEVNVNGNTIEIHYADADNVTTKLELVELTFSVDDNLAAGLYADWLVWSNNSEDDAFTTTGFNNGTPQYEDLTIETAFPALFIRQQGDAYNNNYDGKVNARDASYILQHAAHMFTMPAVDQRYANVYTNDNLADGTAKISARDASLILQYAAHMDVTLSDRINVTFYALDESGNYTVQVVKSVKKGSDLTKLPAVLSKGEGKEGSWSASAEGFATPNFTNITESFSVYAHYEDAIFNITYDFDGKQGVYADGVSNPLEYTEKDSFILKDLEDVPGYDFIGWYNNFNQKIDKIEVGTTGDITLKAGWKLHPYKITYDLGNAKNHENNFDNEDGSKTYTIKSKTFTLADPTLVGYHFVGWLDENGQLIKQIPEGTTGDIHLTPKWSGVTASIVPYAQINSPIYKQVDIVEQSDGKIVYVYYLGYIANVPTGTADLSNIKDWQGVGTWELKTEETNATTSSTTTYGKIVDSKTTNWENGLAEKVEIKAESSAFGGAVKGSVSGSVEAHQSWGQNITGTHESGQDVVTGTVNEKLTSETYTLDDKSPIGFYWYSVKTTVDVFALVEYDPKSQTITYDTARVWRNAYTTGWTYATSMDEIMTPGISGDYDDFCFEVPDDFFADIAKLAGGSTGLIAQENGTECSIVGYTGTDKNVQIPTYLNGKKVTSFDSDLFAGNTLITSVSFGRGITSVPDSAFEGCTSLNSVVFEGELTEIGANAFKDCSALIFDIPNTVESIGASAFDGCKSINNVTISSAVTSLGAAVFNNCGDLSLTVKSGDLTLVQTAISSGATSIYIDWISSEVAVDANCTLTVPAIQTFKFDGNLQTFNNLCIVSDAINTTIEYATIINSTGENALTFASTNVNLRAMTVESNKTVLALSAESLNLSLGGTVSLTAKNGGNGLTANNLIITPVTGEAATLNATGGVGSAGGNGISVNGTLTISEYITLNAYGGTGSAGSKGHSPSDTGNGGRGTDGSTGGIGIVATDIVVSNGANITALGGTGGRGGDGGNSRNKYWGSANDAGDGATGGTGGIGVSTSTLTIDSISTFTINGGNGGRGGDGGLRDTRYGNGDRGSGGSGGSGGLAITSDAVVTGNISTTNGSGGGSGSTGGDWKSG